MASCARHRKGASIYYVRKISRILDPLPPSFAISRNLFFSAKIPRNGTGYLVVFQIFNITPKGGYWTLILASLEWGQAPKPPSFVALRATTQSTRWSLIQHWWQPKNKREWRYVEFSSGDSSIFTQKLETISKNLGGNPSWALPTRDCPLGFWIFSLVFSWIFCNPPSLTSTYCYILLRRISKVSQEPLSEHLNR